MNRNLLVTKGAAFKLSGPKDNPFWEQSHPGSEKKVRERKMPLIEATLLCLQCLRAAHTFGPIKLFHIIENMSS